MHVLHQCFELLQQVQEPHFRESFQPDLGKHMLKVTSSQVVARLSLSAHETTTDLSIEPSSTSVFFRAGSAPHLSLSSPAEGLTMTVYTKMLRPAL